ncbi:MAG: hypothetical protein KC486_32510, partial [Myxococcales bacterium]|nr:hypothetical protein [Myxococcales bacterium]
MADDQTTSAATAEPTATETTTTTEAKSGAATMTRFGTFTGVFTPTLLTILGVIMYVRIGWVVGNAGLAGALLILGLGILITMCTGLSLSSIATNTRIGPGGPYAIMNKSLGLEVGGSIGIPLYLTRPLGVAMYIFGFREGVMWILPGLSPLAVDLGIFALLFGIAYKSADLAFKTQYAIMVAIVLSLVSIFASPAPFVEETPIQWWGTYPGEPETGFRGSSFWMVFAVFFPATTGILAGANMSGDLKDPRRAIPQGTIWAIAISTVIYFAIAVWAANTGSLEELAGNYNHVIDNSLFPPLVLAGLLGATASSALAGLVGGPRILMAMGQNGIIPYSKEMAKIEGGEPRNALALTGILTLAAIMLRDLNAIAPLVTMFFLITYCMINVVVLVEGSLGLVSYRPTLKVPLLVPAFGLTGCLFSMFIINPTFSLISVGVVIALYFFIQRKTRGKVLAKEDVRSSIFVAFAEWAAAKITPEDANNVRAWKPHVLVPVEDIEILRGNYPTLLDLAQPEGTIKLLGIASEQPASALAPRLERVGRAMREQGVLASWSMVRLRDRKTAVVVGLEALQGAFFRPNLLFLRLPEAGEVREDACDVMRAALANRVGVVLFGAHPTANLGRRRDIHLWVRPGRDSWEANDAFGSGNLNLILLLGYRLWRLWGGRLTLITVIRDGEEAGPARAFLDELCDLARFPSRVERRVIEGDLATALESLPAPDLSVFGLQRDTPDLNWAERTIHDSRSSCLFVLDSGRESAR